MTWEGLSSPAPRMGWVCYTLFLRFLLPGFYASKSIQKNIKKTNKQKNSTLSYWGLVCGMIFVYVCTHHTFPQISQQKYHRGNNAKILQKHWSFLSSPPEFLGGLQDFSLWRLVDVNWRSHIHHSWPSPIHSKTKQVSKDHHLGEVFRWQNFLPKIPKSVDQLKLILLPCLLLMMPALDVFICADHFSK